MTAHKTGTREEWLAFDLGVVARSFRSSLGTWGRPAAFNSSWAPAASG